MLWVGLTGGIASGKSSVSSYLRQKSIPVVDADQLAHQALQVHTSQIENLFGPGLVDKDGTVNRATLGQRVFADPVALSTLESVLHPWIQEQVRTLRQQYASQGVQLAVYDVPLLFEKNMEGQFDQVVLVYAPYPVMLSRLMKRNNLSQPEAELRLSRQLNIEDKRARADVVLDNQSTLEHLYRQIDSWLVQSKANE